MLVIFIPTYIFMGVTALHIKIYFFGGTPDPADVLDILVLVITMALSLFCL